MDFSNMPPPFSHQKPTPPESRATTPVSSDEAFKEGLWMKGKGNGEKGKRCAKKGEQDSNPGSSKRAPPPPPPREHGSHSSAYSTPVPLDVNEMACSLTVGPGDVPTAARIVAGVEHLNLGDEHREGHLSPTTIGNKSGEQNYEQFTSTSEIPVDVLNTNPFRNALFTSPQRPTPVAASSLHSQGQSPAKVQVEGRVQ
ncbi:Uncharacterized protein TCAP_04519 [Tolypocladium capitatum]|uniref:Uncharacterized protein n=1 Tax=Tolypocladium capitatum TaxID=45235 RepID=A0A2K3QDD5_9HYPO|nr:Uncharacterized protein TCAP_04519 [Tolypocladium capitatum]